MTSEVESDKEVPQEDTYTAAEKQSFRSEASTTVTHSSPEEPESPPPKPPPKPRGKKPLENDEAVAQSANAEPKKKRKQQDVVECAKCGKSGTRNHILYKHECEPEKVMPTGKSVPKAKAKTRISMRVEREPVAQSAYEPSSDPYEPSTPKNPKQLLRDTYRQIRNEEFDRKTAMYKSWLM